VQASGASGAGRSLVSARCACAREDVQARADRRCGPLVRCRAAGFSCCWAVWCGDRRVPPLRTRRGRQRSQAWQLERGRLQGQQRRQTARRRQRVTDRRHVRRSGCAAPVFVPVLRACAAVRCEFRCEQRGFTPELHCYSTVPSLADRCACKLGAAEQNLTIAQSCKGVTAAHMTVACHSRIFSLSLKHDGGLRKAEPRQKRRNEPLHRAPGSGRKGTTGTGCVHAVHVRRKCAWGTGYYSHESVTRATGRGHTDADPSLMDHKASVQEAGRADDDTTVDGSQALRCSCQARRPSRSVKNVHECLVDAQPPAAIPTRACRKRAAMCLERVGIFSAPMWLGMRLRRHCAPNRRGVAPSPWAWARTGPPAGSDARPRR
jgi:hypothetical protein